MNVIRKKKLPLLTVLIVAGGGRRKQLFRCIQSALALKHASIEVLIVDNSCNKQTRIDLNKTFPEISILVMHKNTALLGFNVGIANARSEFILLLDDDCEIKATELKKIIQMLRNLSSNIAVVSFNVYNPLSRTYTYQSLLRNNVTNLLTFAGGAAIIRKSVLDKAGYFDDEFFLWMHEDDLAMRIIENGYRILFERNIVINHYEKEEYVIRKNKLFLVFRNKAWFNLKYFSIIFFPLQIAKDLWWICKNEYYVLSFIIKERKPSDLTALFYPWHGYLMGYLTFFRVWKKRVHISFELQKRYVYFFVFNKFI